MRKDLEKKIKKITCLILDVDGVLTDGKIVVAGESFGDFAVVRYLGSCMASTLTKTDASCSGVCDGSATITASGGMPPYNYMWSNGGTNSTEGGLCSGGYFVTVTDLNNCTSADSVTV